MIYQVTIPLLEQLENIAAANNFSIVTNLGSYVSAIVGLFLIVASIATIIYLVWGGINWITAGSDKGKVEEARTRLTNAIIGLTIVAASWAVFLILNYFFGLGIVGDSGGGGSSSGSGSNGLCSSASAAQCQGQDPGDPCHNGNQACVATGQTGSDGLVVCVCQ